MAVGPPGIGTYQTCIMAGVTRLAEPAGQPAERSPVTPTTRPAARHRLVCTCHCVRQPPGCGVGPPRDVMYMAAARTACCWAVVGAVSHGFGLAIRIPGMAMLVSGMVMSPAGVVVASLTDGEAGIVGPDMAGPDIDDPDVLADAGSPFIPITISGPPSTRATLSRTAMTAAVAPGSASNRARGTWRRAAWCPVRAVPSQAQPATTTASSTVHSTSPKPAGSTSFGVGPTTSPAVRVTM